MNHPKHHSNCPYWSVSSQICKANPDGLFIPLDFYALTYCKTAKHTECPQYCLAKEHIREDGIHIDRIPNNRKKTPRKKYL